MLRAMTWLIRAGAFVLVGAEVFRHELRGPGTYAVSVAGYALSGLLLVLCGTLDLRGGRDARYAAWRPYLLGGIAVAAGAPSTSHHAGPMVALLLIAVMDAGSETTLRESWGVVGVGVLAVEIGALVVTDVSREIVLGYPLLMLVALLAGHQRRSYRVQAEQSAAMLAQVEQLRSEQRQVAVLDERTRIAREIHDVLAHSLGALGIQIQAARALLTDHHDTGRAVDVLAKAQRMAADGLTETRRAVHALRADTAPLHTELAAMAEAHQQRHRAAVGLTVRGEPVPLPSDHTLSLVRAAQESLTNAAKHAPTRRVDITLCYEDHDVTLTVSNPLGHRADGDPHFATVDGGYGLTGMRERLLLLGGTLTAGTEADRWVVTARLPR